MSETLQAIFSQGLDAWIDRVRGGDAAWTADFRRRAADHYETIGLPDKRDEDWRQINLSAISGLDRVVPERPGAVSSQDLDRFAIDGLDAVRLVVVDGFFSAQLSDLDALDSRVEATGLESTDENLRTLVKAGFERHATAGATGFEALNAAWCHDCIVLHAARNQVIDRPIHFLHVSTVHADPTIVHPRIMLQVGSSAQLTVVEDHLALDGSTDFVNAVVELHVDSNASLDWIRIVRTGPEHQHVESTRIVQAADSRVRAHSLVVEGAMVRQDLRAHLSGSGGEVSLSGLVVIGGKQVADHHTWIHHEVPHTRSVEHFRNVIDDHARAVFMGRVIVAEGAKGTDAEQHNANLLLSDDAQVNALPQLEIYNDDVKASHGSTLGQLDDNALFYLRSRGIDEATARGLLTFAFANTVVESIALPALRRFVRQRVFKNLPHENLSEELV